MTKLPYIEILVFRKMIIRENEFGKISGYPILIITIQLILYIIIYLYKPGKLHLLPIQYDKDKLKKYLKIFEYFQKVFILVGTQILLKISISVYLHLYLNIYF